MNSRECILSALDRKIPDRLPVVNHFVMPYFLNKYMGGISVDEYFDITGIDPILWTISHKPDVKKSEFFEPDQGEPGFLESRRIASDRLRIEKQPLGKGSVRYTFVTPGGNLTMTLSSNEYTSWVTEHLIKEKKDIDLISKYVTQPLCDVGDINRKADAWGSRGIVRGCICCFDIFGQPGCFQDAACLVGTERLLLETFDDPYWVHELLKILFDRKKHISGL